MPSATLEEYLEIIYKLSGSGEVRPTQVADALQVSGATVTATLRRMESAGLVERPGGGVSLTESGRREALDLIRRHRVAERFLVDMLGLSWDAAHEEACRLEHALSPRVLEALESYLSNPDVCPHGHPIPGVDGSVADTGGTPLTDVSDARPVAIASVPEDDEAVLSFLGEAGMRPGARLAVVQEGPANGPLLVEVEGVRHALDRQVASRIMVRSAK